jgi:hypothetical protein
MLLVLVLPALFAACSGSDNVSSKLNADTDTTFVTGLCKAAKTFGDTVEKSLAGPTPSDLGAAFSAFFEAIGPGVQTFSDSFAKLTPPADLEQWHRDSAQKLSAAAKALKAGNFDDPSLDALSQSPIPDMPTDARTRLKAIADKTDVCKGQQVFDDPATTGTGNGVGNSNTPTPALQDAATGTWKGDFGTLVFNSDGTAKFSLKSCGGSSSSKAPFGVDHDCAPSDYTGTLKVGADQYTLGQPNGGGTIFQAFVDKAGKLHVGVGSISPFPAGKKGTVDVFASAPITVDGGSCTTTKFGSKTAEKVACTWKKRDGQDVLEFDNGFGSTDFLVIDRELNLAISPEVYASVFMRSR